MAGKNKRPKRIDTEAAARWVEKNWSNYNFTFDICYSQINKCLSVKIYEKEGKVLDVPFSWLWKKRQPLTGITKRLKKAVRGKK